MSLVRLGREPPREASAKGMLLECHDRIRSFTALVMRLADAESVSSEDVAESARAIVRYFTVALPLHHQDEDESLLPRLGALGRRDVTEALATMTRQHAEIDAHLADLVPRWRALASGSSVSRQETRQGAAELSTRMGEHLELEEAVILPALDALDPALEAAITQEIHGRRASAPSPSGRP